jgi:TonB family protein
MKTALLFTLVIFLFVVAAPAEDLVPVLNSAYLGKAVVLRHPIAGSALHFNSDGKSTETKKEGAWTVDGGLEIRKIELTPTTLRLGCNRVVFGFDERKKALVPFRTKQKEKITVNVEIALTSPIESLPAADEVLHRIFTFTETELLEMVPDYWQDFLRKQIFGTLPMPVPTPAVPRRDPKQERKQSQDFLESLKAKGVTPPRPVHTPEPHRINDMTGTVVLETLIDENGKVQQPKIIRPVGYGLDEEAVATVVTWSFKPATRDGKPVPMHMAIEVAFMGYR